MDIWVDEVIPGVPSTMSPESLTAGSTGREIPRVGFVVRVSGIGTDEGEKGGLDAKPK